MKLRNKVIFITDADSFSGKALVNRLSGEGAHFILNSESNGSLLEAELVKARTAGSEIFVVQRNLCRSNEVAEVLDQANLTLGKVDVLIHNNDLLKPALAETCEENIFLEIINANAKSAFICTQTVGRQMIGNQNGKIIYISSIHAEKPTGTTFAYSASKGAIKMLSKEAALELGRHGVQVNTIELGPMKENPDRFISGLSALYDSYERKIPSDQPGSYEDLAHLVLYLVSDEARYINGTDIRLDGGFLLHYMDHKMKRPL
ncbi:SDR family NAD(P)-dependent oxidoreductase [Paenibacillus nasutitermitis]|uniref:Gluconate 5-dehydrogenase n=1 Tax=Paenibacillus nasutitermitis TaxID=1652958 RepID=A0A917DNZ8_9BACL|nr:SDR family oxidoreductase [Paenibacillus nasutitermitis]GGD57138.1 gluconate 5-dehydrogenase [Paenibacillus nasutitermitis]